MLKNKKMELEKIEKQIREKQNELLELMKKKKEVELETLERFLKGKLLKFGSDGVVPLPLKNKYIYVPDNDTYGIFLSERYNEKNRLDLYINCITFESTISEYVDDNYMLIDLGNQIVVPFDKYNTAKDIMDSAEEVDKAELLEFINKSFKSILEITKNKINDKINKNHDN